MNDHQVINPNGWHKLVDGYPWFEREGGYPLPAYSEFMPPPRLGRTPYGDINSTLFSEEDPYGWTIPEIEEEYQLKPGLANIARQVMNHLIHLGQGLPEYHIAGHKGGNLLNNPYWPEELAARAGKLNHERYVSFLPLALSKTQDDKGRVRWTFFGGSEQGPELAFWKSFYTAPGEELPREEALSFFVRLLSSAYGEIISQTSDLHSIGFAILPVEAGSPSAYPEVEQLPSWVHPFIIDGRSSFDHIRYLLTFRPFSHLPAAAREAYLSGKLSLLPFPGSLVFWGMPTYLHLAKDLPMARQIPLQRMVTRHHGPAGIRVPQTGWLHVPRLDLEPSEVQSELLAHTYIRTHRWDRVHRFEDELSVNPRVEKVIKVLFSTDLDVLGLYDKPMARNCQLWTRDFELLLDGPLASPRDIHKAEAAFIEGGLFGYRFQFPAMQVGLHEVYWHRPVVAYVSPRSGEVELLSDSPLGYSDGLPAGLK